MTWIAHLAFWRAFHHRLHEAFGSLGRISRDSPASFPDPPRPGSRPTSGCVSPAQPPAENGKVVNNTPTHRQAVR